MQLTHLSTPALLSPLRVGGTKTQGEREGDAKILDYYRLHKNLRKCDTLFSPDSSLCSHITLPSTINHKCKRLLQTVHILLIQSCHCFPATDRPPTIDLRADNKPTLFEHSDFLATRRAFTSIPSAVWTLCVWAWPPARKDDTHRHRRLSAREIKMLQDSLSFTDWK